MRNIAEGEDGSIVYWRVDDAIQDDPMLDMFSQRIRQGICKTVHAAAVDENNKVKPYTTTRSFFINLRKNILPATPIAFTGDKCLDHMASIIEQAMFPERKNK